MVRLTMKPIEDRRLRLFECLVAVDMLNNINMYFLLLCNDENNDENANPNPIDVKLPLNSPPPLSQWFL